MKRFAGAVVAVVLGASCATTGTSSKTVAAATPAAGSTNSRGPQETFDEAVAAFDAGRFAEARKGFEAVLGLKADSAVVHQNLGVTLEKLGDLKGALEQYQAALKLNPVYKPALLNLGKAYRSLDRHAEAIALYEGALKQPGYEYDVALLNNLTVAYRLAKQFDKAEGTVKRLLARTKDNADAYKNLALIYFDQGNYRLAEFVFGNARKLDDKDAGVYNNLGLIYLKMDERRLALGQFQKAVSLNPNHAPGYVNLGAMALSYRDYVSAEKSFARAIELDPTSYETYLAYAWALDGQKGRDPKKGSAAGTAFEKVLGLKPDSTEAICGAGWAFAADKTSFDRAASYLEKCKGGAAPADVAAIDAKLKTIQAMQKGAAPAEAPTKEKEKPKASGGPSMLDKVSDDAAKSEPQAPPATEAAPAKPQAAEPEKKQ